MNKEIVKKLLSSSSGEDQKLGLEYLQYLEDEELEEIIPYFSKWTDGFKNHTKIFGFISLKNSLLLFGVGTIVRYKLEDYKKWKEQYQQLNKNLTPWQENPLTQQNLDK